MIRRAVPDDLAALAPLMVEFNQSEQIAWDPDVARPAIERLLASDEVGFILAALEDDVLIGYTVVTWGFDLEFAGRDAMLTELFIAPSHRRKHLGTALVEAAMARAGAAGAAALHLMVDPAKPGAIALYRRADFEPSRRVMMTHVYRRMP